MKTYKSEADVKSAIKQILRDNDVWYFMPSMNGFGRAGIPDFVCCVAGKFLSIEAKFGNNKATVHQLREIDEIARHGGTALLVSEKELCYLTPHIQALKTKGDNASSREET